MTRSKATGDGFQQNIQPNAPEMHVHGPQNAEHELRKSYNTLIEAELTYAWDRKEIPGVRFQELSETYKKAYDCFRSGDRLAAERWARTSKHLARAFWHEAKIAFLEPRLNIHPYLQGALPDEYNLHERIDTTEDLLTSVGDHVPPGMDQSPPEMRKYLSRGQFHLDLLKDPNIKHELLRAEHIKAAHEYGRVLECIALAYEAELQGKKKAA